MHLAVERRLKSTIRHQRTSIWTVSYCQALALLRQALAAVNVPYADTYGFHAFRRGLSQDLLSAGTPLRDILAACDWKSSTFAWYLARENIDKEAVLKAAAELSDSDPQSP